MSSPAENRRSASVVLIDDHDVVHMGVRAWCQQAQPPVTVVAAYPDPQLFIDEQRSDIDEIDVVLLDLELHSRDPDFTGLKTLVAAGHRVIVYSHIVDHEIILRCLDYGALCYIAKTEGREHLIDAIHAAAIDELYVGPRMAAAMRYDATVGRPHLTERERQVLLAWFQTESKELVAQQMFLAVSSIKSHLQRIRAKYAAVGRPASTKAALVARALQDGIIGMNDL